MHYFLKGTALFFLIAFVTAHSSVAQQDTLVVKGKITNDNQTPLNHTMIINKRSNTGSFVSVDGTFQETLLRTDTLVISSVGYATQKICFRDSSGKKDFNITIKLGGIQYKLREVSIYPDKTLNQVDKQINEIGVKPTNTYKDLNALESPVTFLYERFSKFERSKRLVAELENQDRRRAALKDLFRIYVKYDIIYLTDEQFDEFVDYCNLPDTFIKSATQYELIKAVQQKYKGYEFSHPAK
jgi:hypothetical protein